MQMEEDDEVLEFHASAGDLLRAESDKEVGSENSSHMTVYSTFEQTVMFFFWLFFRS